MGRVREGGWGKDRSSQDTTPPTCRRGSRHREGQPARVEREDPAEEQEPEGAEEGEDGGGGGAPPEQPRTPFVRGLNQEMGGKPQDLRRTPPPPQDEAEGKGKEQEIRTGQETEGAHLPH